MNVPTRQCHEHPLAHAGCAEWIVTDTPYNTREWERRRTYLFLAAHYLIAVLRVETAEGILDTEVAAAS